MEEEFKKLIILIAEKYGEDFNDSRVLRIPFSVVKEIEHGKRNIKWNPDLEHKNLIVTVTKK